jgi:TP901 family phage tail tape measure protein
MANNVIDAAIRLRDLFTPTVRSVNASLGTMKTQMAAAKQSVSGLSDKLTEHERIQKRTAKSIEQTGGKISGLSDKMALLSAPILAAATAGFKLHSDFAGGIAKISTLVDTTVVSMQKVSDEIRAVSDETGAGVADLSESVYQAISAGVDAAHAVGFVKDMTIAAKAGFTDTTTAVNGVTTVLNAYGKSAEEATAVTDQMLLAQNFGKTSFGEMAQSMGNVIPIAAQLNISTQELFGSIAVLTKNGIRTSEAITGLKAAYSNILKPSSEAAKLAQSLGLEFNAAHLQSVGWVKFLDEVKRATDGDAEQMAQLFGSVEGLNSILVLTGKGAGDFDKVMDQMAQSAGMTREAYEKMLTPSEQMQIAMNQLKNAGMDLAVSFTPYFKTMSMRVKELAAWFRSLTPEQKTLIGQVAFGIVTFQLFGSTLGRMLTIGGRAFGTFNSIAAGISKAGSVSKYLSTQFKGLIPVCRGIAIVAKGMGSTFLTVPDADDHHHPCRRRRSHGQSHHYHHCRDYCCLVSSVEELGYGVAVYRTGYTGCVGRRRCRDATGLFGLGRSHERYQRDGFQHLGEHQGYLPERCELGHRPGERPDFQHQRPVYRHSVPDRRGADSCGL